MHNNFRLAAVATVALALVSSAALLTKPTGAAIMASHKAPTGVALGKSIVLSKCAGCHGAALTGNKGFSPGITPSTGLKHYTKAQFERAMLKGVDEHGHKLKKPMPTFGFNAVRSDAVYAYLKTRK